jgi:hypothetical protein
MPPSGVPSYGNGRAYEKLRGEVIRVAARLGGISGVVQMSGELDRMRKARITSHMEAALLLAQQGRQADAALEMQRATYLISPGIKTRVSPGPNGLFVFQNYDDKDNFVGAAGYTVDQIMEMVHAYKDIGSYHQYKLDRMEAQQRMEFNAQLQPYRLLQAQLELQNLQLQVDGRALGNSAAALELAVKRAELGLPIGGDVSGDAIVGAVESRRIAEFNEQLGKFADEVQAKIKEVGEEVVKTFRESGGVVGATEQVVPGLKLPYYIDDNGQINAHVMSAVRAMAEAIYVENRALTPTAVATAIRMALFEPAIDITLDQIEVELPNGGKQTRDVMIFNGLHSQTLFLPPQTIDTFRSIVFGQREQELRNRALAEAIRQGKIARQSDLSSKPDVKDEIERTVRSHMAYNLSEDGEIATVVRMSTSPAFVEERYKEELRREEAEKARRAGVGMFPQPVQSGAAAPLDGLQPDNVARVFSELQAYLNEERNFSPEKIKRMVLTLPPDRQVSATARAALKRANDFGMR